MARPRLSPAAYRSITLATLMALGFIIVTGGAVRLTGSGLGCPDWPTCSEGRLVPEWEYHQLVESVNRAITGLVSIFVIVAVLGSLVRRPRRRDLVWLSAGLVAGVVGQIVLGGLTVLFKLRPGFVMAHFLLSMVLLANAVVLHHRAGEPDGEGPAPDEAGGRGPSAPRPPVRPVVGPDLLALGRLVVAAAAVVLLMGTVVTSSGPHGGDENAERLSFPLHQVARLHGLTVVLFLLLTVVTLWRLTRAGAPRQLLRRGEVLLGVLVAQAAVGYVQYFTGVPALLVAVHIAGAAVVWAAAVRFLLAFAAPVPDPPSPAAPTGSLLACG